MSTEQPSPEDLLRQIKVDDVLLQTAVTLINLGGRRLTMADEKDVDQGRQAIEAARALLPLCPQEEIGPLRDALSQLQMIYVRESQGQAPAPEPETSDAEERAKARSKIWTPGNP